MAEVYPEPQTQFSGLHTIAEQVRTRTGNSTLQVAALVFKLSTRQHCKTQTRSPKAAAEIHGTPPSPGPTIPKSRLHSAWLWTFSSETALEIKVVSNVKEPNEHHPYQRIKLQAILGRRHSFKKSTTRLFFFKCSKQKSSRG